MLKLWKVANQQKMGNRKNSPHSIILTVYQLFVSLNSEKGHPLPELSFDSTSGHAADDVALEKECQNDGR
jgi:hypothetical protein